ncbi:YncE family protein [Bacillus sp. CGMCC 1.16607]|uniref:YncE family protein n=1 Tax=Bacillus sp. CGMCC 1.16607 TaxID=3351842 RepID=UPI00362A4707
MEKIKLGIFILLILIGGILGGCSSKSEEKENEVDGAPKEEADTDQSSLENIKYLFTANEGGSITKINASTNEVVDTIKVDGAVHNVQVSPDGKTLGATVVPEMGHGSHDEDSMEMKGKALFFDTATNDLLKSIEVGNHPAHIVFTENGKYAVVTNNEDNDLSIIDTESFTLVETVETGKGPHGFRISTDSQKAYIANMGEDTISVINLEEMKEEKKIKLGSTPVTTGITSDGKTLLVTLYAENMLAIVDLATDHVKKVEVGKGPAQVYVDGNNQFAYVANQGTEDEPSTSVSVIDLGSMKVKTSIETGKGAHGVVTSPDSKRLYVTNMFENTVTVINTEQNKVIDKIDVGEIPNGISIMK